MKLFWLVLKNAAPPAWTFINNAVFLGIFLQAPSQTGWTNPSKAFENTNQMPLKRWWSTQVNSKMRDTAWHHGTQNLYCLIIVVIKFYCLFFLNQSPFFSCGNYTLSSTLTLFWVHLQVNPFLMEVRLVLATGTGPRGQGSAVRQSSACGRWKCFHARFCLRAWPSRFLTRRHRRSFS